MDEEAATKADSGRPDCNRSAAERRLGVRAIARKLGRSPSVISTEIGRGREPDRHLLLLCHKFLTGDRDAARLKCCC